MGRAGTAAVKPYVRDLALSAKPFTGKRDLPHDLAVRTGTFVRGMRTLYARLEFGLLSPSASLRIRILRPDGSAALGEARPVGFGVHHGRGQARLAYRLALAVTGSWRLVVDVDGETVADAPFAVVAGAGQVRNRRPNPIAASLHPAVPTAADVVQCRVATSLVTEDPDFEIVRYRYRWTVGGRVMRTVSSAALSDVVRKGTATSGQQLSCTVTPGDGRLAGPTATASTTVR